MSLSTCNRELDKLVFSRPNKTLIYGEAASGKTNFLLNVIKCSTDPLKSGYVIFYISTEGSIFLERALKLRILEENIFISIALDQRHLASLILDIMRMLDRYKPLCIIIDSINSHYRVESSTQEGLAMFVKILAMLDILNRRKIYIISSAQIRSSDEEQEIPGYEYIYRWADIALSITREHPFYRVLRFRKPYIEKLFYFDISLTG
ncbi:MAG: hypothetical protein QXF79_00700, partial [Ignisphaera sp.]